MARPGCSAARRFLAASGAVLVVGPSLAACSPDREDVKRLAFLNWQDYIAAGLLVGFTEDSGVEVTYDTYESNDELAQRLEQASRTRRRRPYRVVLRPDRAVGQLRAPVQGRRAHRRARPRPDRRTSTTSRRSSASSTSTRATATPSPGPPAPPASATWPPSSTSPRLRRVPRPPVRGPGQRAGRDPGRLRRRPVLARRGPQHHRPARSSTPPPTGSRRWGPSPSSTRRTTWTASPPATSWRSQGYSTDVLPGP